MSVLQLIRSLFSLLLSLVVAQAQGVERWFGSPKLWLFLAARGFTGAASMTLYYEGIARMPLADAVGFSWPLSAPLAGLGFTGYRGGMCNFGCQCSRHFPHAPSYCNGCARLDKRRIRGCICPALSKPTC